MISGRCGLAMLVILLLTAAGAAAIDPTPQQQRQDLRVEVGRLHAAGDHAAALEACRLYLEVYPGDADMLYNRACLESRLGLTDDAVHSLQDALTAGYDDLAGMREDPDLAALAGDEDFEQLLAAELDAAARASRDRSMTLAWKTWSDSVALTVATVTTGPGDEVGPVDTGAGLPPHLRLRWLDEGLELELTGPGPWAELAETETPAPWDGGPGVVATVAVPDGTLPFASAQYFVFAFGTDLKTPAAAFFDAEAANWTALPPETIHIEPGNDSDRVTLRCVMPWRHLRPFHPLVDPQLGVNVAVRTTDPVRPLRADLLPDRSGFRPDSPSRRFVPVTFDEGSLAGTVFLGKVSDSVTGAQPLDLDLLAVSPRDGSGRLTIDFQDPEGRSLLPDGAHNQGVHLAAGANRVRNQADFSALPPGNYVIRVELTFPGGEQTVWSTPILHLPASWFTALQEQMADMPPTEAATMGLLVGEVEARLQSHQRRRNPEPIARQARTVNALHDRWRATESLLPEAGRMLLVLPDTETGGELMTCAAYLPAGHRQAARLRPVILLMDPRLPAPPVANRIARNYEYGDLRERDPDGKDLPVYLIPGLPALDDSEAARSVADWALDYFSADTFALGGLDAAAIAALATARQHAANCVGVLAYSSVNLARYLADDGEARLQPALPAADDLPVTWLDFPATRRALAPQLDPLIAVREGGWTIAEVMSIRGGLNPTQIADHIVLWAENLR